LNAIVLQVGKYARASGWIQSREGAAIAGYGRGAQEITP